MKQNTCFIIIAPKTNEYWSEYNHKLSIKIKNNYLINYHIDNILNAYPNARIIVAGDFYGMSIKKHKRVQYKDIQFDECLNIGGILLKIISGIKNQSICIMNVGLIFSMLQIKKLNICNTAMVANEHKKFKSKIGCVIKDKSKIESIFYDLENYLCELLYVHCKDIAIFKQVLGCCVKKYMYLFEIGNMLMKHNVNINLYTTKINALHLESPEELPKAKRLLNYISKGS
jgi:hypothetical protein